jgi:hypothetical protein
MVVLPRNEDGCPPGGAPTFAGGTPGDVSDAAGGAAATGGAGCSCPLTALGKNGAAAAKPARKKNEGMTHHGLSIPGTQLIAVKATILLGLNVRSRYNLYPMGSHAVEIVPVGVETLPTHGLARLHNALPILLAHRRRPTRANGTKNLYFSHAVGSVLDGVTPASEGECANS